eukprot:g12605.t1
MTRGSFYTAIRAVLEANDCPSTDWYVKQSTVSLFLSVRLLPYTPIKQVNLTCGDNHLCKIIVSIFSPTQKYMQLLTSNVFSSGATIKYGYHICVDGLRSVLYDPTSRMKQYLELSHTNTQTHPTFPYFRTERQ